MSESLTINTYLVEKVEFGERTILENRTLIINRADVLKVVLSDPRITGCDLELVEPGESTRVTGDKDVVEPRIKVSGSGVVYPGINDREVTAVGTGVTNRLSGVSVVEISAVKSFNLADKNQSNSIHAKGLFDMSGPGGDATPYGKLMHICLSLEVTKTIGQDDQNWALHAATLRVSDLLAKTTLDREPDESEIFDTSNMEEGLPGIVYIPCMNSPEHYANSLEAYGVAIYGETRQTPPWVLRPTELLDGAICGGYSWQMTNNPVVLGLLRKHQAKQCNFLGVVTIRTRWSSQAEKNVTSNQAANICKLLGADGALVTWDAGGNDFMEVARTIQACEKIGVKTVFMTAEEDPRSGGPPLLEPLSEMDAIVSTGMGANMWNEPVPMPSVDRVVGPSTVLITDGNKEKIEIPVDSYSEISSLQWKDHYGFGFRTVKEY